MGEIGKDVIINVYARFHTAPAARSAHMFIHPERDSLPFAKSKHYMFNAIIML
jgi:hypothetical protein